MAWSRAQRASEAGDVETALCWLKRARRLLPDDDLVGLTLGSVLLASGDAEGAVALLRPIVARGIGAQAWVALAAATAACGTIDQAVLAVTAALQRGIVTPELAKVATLVTSLAGLPGWCSIDAEGRLQVEGRPPLESVLDGVAVDASEVIGRGETLVVRGAEGALLGSPLPIGQLRAVQGFVAEVDGGLQGWAWHPADPGRAPLLTLSGPGGVCSVLLESVVDGIEGLSPIARPRRISVDATTLTALGSPVAVLGPGARHLLGSPIWRGILPLPPISEAARVDLSLRAIDVVMPVYGAAAETLAGLQAVLASVPADSVVHVVDDASPDPALGAALDRLVRDGRIRLYRHAETVGFPGAANTGMRAAAGRDVVLLNSDTVVPPGWLERLRAAAYAAPEIGTATPLSGDGTIVSYGDGVPGLDTVAAAANAGLVATLPVGVGFCLFIRRDCLDQVGSFREDLFAQGYGEESDFCLRAAACGWRHVAALDVFVEHHGGRSFGAGRGDLRRRNQAILERHYPGYAALVAAHVAADPLFAARRRMDALRWAAGRRAAAVVLVSHGAGGGVDELVAARAAALRVEGGRPVVVVPAQGGCRIEGFADLRFAVPEELPDLAALLRGDGVRHVEVHHLLGHDHGVLGLAGLLGVPVETWLHDAAAFCPRIALIGPERRYCGEPEVAVCVACVAAAGSNLLEPIGVEALVARSAADLAGSRRVVVPSADMARRIRRHFPAVRAAVVPWEDDGGWPAVEMAVGATVRVCVVGAIGVEKGYDVLLGCAVDAQRRGLALEFVVCGTTADDERLMAAGPVFVTGRYDPAEAVELIRAQGAAVAFIPSIWPETWCFALSRAWGAGLAAVAFDLGAPAERIQATGRGWLLPLGLPVERVNDALLRLASASAGLQP